MNKRFMVLLPLVLAASLFLVSQTVPKGHAGGYNGTGLVCITASSSATNCPNSPPIIGPLTVGSSFTVGVFVNNSQPMGGFDIYVAANASYLNPTNVVLGSLIATPTSTNICINGVSVTGSCSTLTANGPGVVEVNTIESTGGNECGSTPPCSGMVFNITYSVVGTFPSTALYFPVDGAGCANSSISLPANICVLVSDNTGTTLPENIQSASIIQTVTVHPTSTTISCAPSPVVVGQQTTCTALVADTNTTAPNFPTGKITATTAGSGGFNPNPCTLSRITTSQSECFFTYTPNSVGTGTHSIGASYPGDTVHSGSSGSFPLSVAPATPTVSTSVVANATGEAVTGVPPGTFVHDTALLIGGFPTTGVSGTVTYTFYSNGNCAAPGTVISTVTVGANDNVPNSASVKLTSYGSYSFQANYTGDANNLPGLSSCEVVVVEPGIVCITSPATSVSCSSAPVNIGPVNVGSKFVVGVFVQNSAPIGGYVVYVSANPAYLSPTSVTLGSLISSPTLTDVCVNGVSVQGTCAVGTVNGPGVVQVSTVESSGGNECGNVPPCSGIAFTINYTVVGTFPSTPISFPADGLGCAMSSVAFPINVCVLVSDNTGSAIPETIQGATVTHVMFVDATSTSVSCTPSPVVVGKPSRCTVTVTDTNSTAPNFPTGTVSMLTAGSGTFTACTLTPISTSQSECFTTYTPTAVGTGTHTIGASYPGDVAHRSSLSGPLSLPVSPASPTLATTIITNNNDLPVNSTRGVTTGSVVHASALLLGGYPVTGISGMVTYTEYANGNCAGSGFIFSRVLVVATNNVPNSGSIILSSPGSYGFQAIYSGDANSGAASSGCQPVTVGTTSTTINCMSNPNAVGASTSCTATITDVTPNPSTPTGIMTFVSNSTGTFITSSCTLTAGTIGTAWCSVNYTPTQIGHHMITGSYAGDSTHATGTSSFNLAAVIRSTTTSITCSPNPDTVGVASTCTAVVTDTASSPTSPSGIMNFATNSTGTFGSTTSCTLTAGSAGTATCSVTYTPSSAGHSVVTASYGGDSTHAVGANSFSLGTALRTITTNISCSPNSQTVGTSTTCTVTVTDTSSSPSSPTGTVSFATSSTGGFSSTSCTLTPGASGASSCTVSYTPSGVGNGSHTLTATYSGDSAHSTSSGTSPLTVGSAPASSSIQLSPLTFYAIIGVIVALGALLAYVELVRRSKTQSPALANAGPN